MVLAIRPFDKLHYWCSGLDCVFEVIWLHLWGGEIVVILEKSWKMVFLESFVFTVWHNVFFCVELVYLHWTLLFFSFFQEKNNEFDIYFFISEKTVYLIFQKKIVYLIFLEKNNVFDINCFFSEKNSLFDMSFFFF